MNVSHFSRPYLCIAMTVAVVLAAATVAVADHHMPNRDAPWGAGNCTMCHGSDLDGGAGPSCMACHNDFTEPDPPASGHHVEGRCEPLTNCTLCHGGDLTGGMGPSCYTCHDALWDDCPPGNLPPLVDTGGPYTGAPGEDVQFDASDTIDPDGDTMTYLWLFGDDSPPQFPSQIPTISHTYAEAGTYTVTLTVTDGVNTPVIETTTVEIGVTSNTPPVSDAGGPYSGTAGQAVGLDGSGSVDIDGDTLTYSWDFGDGSPASASSTVPTISHTYANAGTYTAVLTVDDGVNAPVADSTSVDVIEDVDPPLGDGWLVRVPYLLAEFTFEMEDFAGVLFFETTHPDGAISFGLGMQTDGIIFWMDASGAIFFGNVDSVAGTMRGVVFDYGGGSSIWFAERL